MAGLARGLVSLLLLAIAAVVLIEFFVPSEGDEGNLSVTLIATLIGAVAVAQLLMALGRSNLAAWRRSTPLWPRDRGSPGRDEPGAVSEWEALLVTAATSDRRGRERLRRRLDPIISPASTDLLDRLGGVEPDDVLATVTRLVEETERSHD
jgi:hypothetical protein